MSDLGDLAELCLCRDWHHQQKYEVANRWANLISEAKPKGLLDLGEGNTKPSDPAKRRVAELDIQSPSLEDAQKMVLELEERNLSLLANLKYQELAHEATQGKVFRLEKETSRLLADLENRDRAFREAQQKIALLEQQTSSLVARLDDRERAFQDYQRGERARYLELHEQHQTLEAQWEEERKKIHGNAHQEVAEMQKRFSGVEARFRDEIEQLQEHLRQERERGSEDRRRFTTGPGLQDLQSTVKGPTGREHKLEQELERRDKSRGLEGSQLTVHGDLDGPRPVSAIGRRILDELGTVDTCEVEFYIHDWDLNSFLRDQFPEQDDELSKLSKVITLTGSLTDAWAVPCGEYLEKTWPDIGGSLLAALQKALEKGATLGAPGKSACLSDFVSLRVELDFLTMTYISRYYR